MSTVDRLLLRAGLYEMERELSSPRYWSLCSIILNRLKGKKSTFDFDDLFGDGSDFDDEDNTFFGGFEFVKKHLGGFAGFDDIDLSQFGAMGGNFKFKSSSSFSSKTKDGVKVKQTVVHNSVHKNGKEHSVKMEQFESREADGQRIDQQRNVKCVTKEVAPGEFKKVCSKEEL